MSQKLSQRPDFIFETSWEVCNKVGGIYTVLATRANTMHKEFGDNVVFIGPDFQSHSNKTFSEDTTLFPDWQAKAKADGLVFRVGRWLIPGQPVVILIDFQQYYSRKNEIYLHLWENHGVDSLHAYGDYDESSMFAYGVARMVEHFYRYNLDGKEDFKNVVFHANEWMLGVSLLYIKKYLPQIATVFTTHATTVGRSIAGNGKYLYGYMAGYFGDQMARELNVESKHSIEKQAALHADCFTTVSEITALECTQLLGRNPDKILLNGFENDFVPDEGNFILKRAAARKRLLDMVGCLTGCVLKEDTLIVSTSGRYEYRNKGIDVFVEAMNKLRYSTNLKRDVVAFIEVPAWVATPREDLQHRLQSGRTYSDALACPYLTHWLHNMETDNVLSAFKNMNVHNLQDEHVKIVFIPCYLDGHDGVVDKTYYDVILGNDLCIYPSYYEPWGYTPLEAIAFSVPCVTTDLTGFGLWAREIMKHEARIEYGVEVVHRTDNNYWDVVQAISNAVERFSALTPAEVQKARSRAARLSKKALWKNFFSYYLEAYDFALRKVKGAVNQFNPIW